MKLAELLQAWDKFWFTKANPAPLAMIRICIGFLAFFHAVQWLPHLNDFFGPHAIVSTRTMHNPERFSLLTVIGLTNESTYVLLAVMAVSSIMVCLGMFTRPATIILWLCLISFHNRNWGILNSGDGLFKATIFLLMFAPSGKMLSIDRWWRERKNKNEPDQWEIKSYVWAQRLMQLELAAMYAQCFWSKMNQANWRNGSAIYYTSRLREFFHYPCPFIFDNFFVCQLLTWSTLALEFSLWTLTWVKEFRYPLLFIGALFHLGIEWSMAIPFFEWNTLALYFAFIDPRDVKRGVEAILRMFKTPEPSANADIAAEAAPVIPTGS